MKNLLKMNLKYHFETNIESIPEELTSDTKHVQQKLNGFLLAKEGISITKCQIFVCKICYVSLKNNKIPKLALANGLWIGITPPMLPKSTMVEETLIACYCCCTILIKLRYTNKGRTTSQHALKGNIVNFAQNLESAIELLNTLPSSLETLTNIIAVHFVGSSHPPIKLVKSCKLLYVRKYDITMWLTWLKSNHVGYKNTSMNTHILNTMPENDIPEPIMKSMFQSTNIELANAEHCTNITDLNQQKGTMKLNMSLKY